MRLKLVNYHSGEEIIFDSDIPIIIGRGPLFRCFDKKVSRNHGQLKETTDGNIHLVALHSNPCFVMKNGIPPVIQLTKNNEKILNNGDYIGLLPNSFWFKVLITRNDNMDASGNPMNEPTSNMGRNLGEGSGQVTSGSHGDNPRDPQPSTSRMEVHSSLVPDSGRDAAERMRASAALAERLRALEHTRRLPIYMYEIDDFSEAASNVAEEDSEISRERTTGGSNGDADGDPTISSTTEDNPQFSIGYDGELNVNSTDGAQDNTPHTSRQMAPFVQARMGNSDPLDFPEGQKRPFCLYESRCYRNNNQHKRDFCHPGDRDFVPYESRPMCPYGPTCLRRSKSHCLEFQHLKKRSCGADSMRDRRRRKAARYRDIPDEEEDDLFDPFLDDDSSDDYQSDFDSDEEMGGGQPILV